MVYTGITDFHKVIPSQAVTCMQISPADESKIIIARTAYLTELAQDGQEHIISGKWAQGYQEGRPTVAKYRLMSAFVPIGSEAILIVDKLNKVIRYFNLTTNQVHRYAGSPTTTGHRDSTRLNALLTSPHGIIPSVLEPNTYYVSDSSTHKIRRLNETHLTTAYDGFR